MALLPLTTDEEEMPFIVDRDWAETFGDMVLEAETEECFDPWKICTDVFFGETFDRFPL